MGMYTEIFFRAEVDEEAASVLRSLFYTAQDRGEWPDHPFFRTDRFRVIATMGSYYFPQTNQRSLVFDALTKSHHATFTANLKDYDDEIDEFFDWVAPHCRDRGNEKTFLGYSLYEEADVPTLYFKEGDGGLER